MCHGQVVPSKCMSPQSIGTSIIIKNNGINNILETVILFGIFIIILPPNLYLKRKIAIKMMTICSSEHIES